MRWPGRASAACALAYGILRADPSLRHLGDERRPCPCRTRLLHRGRCMSRRRQYSRTVILVWMSAFATLALILPTLGAWSLLLHAHDEEGHHLHALPETTAVEPDAAWHEHQHEDARSGEHEDEPRDESRQPGLGSIPQGLVLHATAPWSFVTVPGVGQLVEAYATFCALLPRLPRGVLEDRECDDAILPRSEWPPPGAASCGVRWLLLKSHALLI